MANLDTLRPEVGEAIAYYDGIFDGADNGEWACIRAELRRLAGIESELANVERGYEKWKRSAESVGAELAAMKARIAEAPTAQLIDQGRATQQWYVRATDGGLLALPPALSGKRVRLVVEE